MTVVTYKTVVSTYAPTWKCTDRRLMRWSRSWRPRGLNLVWAFDQFVVGERILTVITRRDQSQTSRPTQAVDERDALCLHSSEVIYRVTIRPEVGN